jgi:hypothetical protein
MFRTSVTWFIFNLQRRRIWKAQTYVQSTQWIIITLLSLKVKNKEDLCLGWQLSRCPLTRLKIIGFVYPFYVYDGNTPLTPILRQRRCSSDVWCFLTHLMTVVMGIKIPGIHSRIRTEYFTGWTWKEQWK